MSTATLRGPLAQQIDLRSMGLVWSSPQPIGDGQWGTVSRTTPAFWDAWRERKDSLRSAGIIAKKFGGDWIAAKLTEPPKEAPGRQIIAGDFPDPPGLTSYPYQREGIAFALARNGALIGDAPGVGKTRQAIGVIDYSGATSALIVCPASLRLNWERECHMWLTRKLTVAVIRNGKQAWPDTNIVILNYDILHRYDEQLKAREWDVLICDEAHTLRNGRKTRYGSRIFGNRNKGVNPLKAKRKVFLTGTPIVNRPGELWPLISYLDPNYWSSPITFAREYCDALPGQVTMKGASNLDRLQVALKHSCFTGDTLIDTEHGRIRIDDIVNRRIHTRVWSRDRVGRVSLKPIVAFHSGPHKGVLVKIRYAEGYVVCTPDHRIFTREGEVRADQIKPSDNVLHLQEEKVSQIINGLHNVSKRDLLFKQVLRAENTVRQETSLRGNGISPVQNTGKAVSGVRRKFHSQKRARVQASQVLHCELPGKMDVPNLLAEQRDAHGQRKQKEERVKSWHEEARNLSGTDGEEAPKACARKIVRRTKGAMGRDEGIRGGRQAHEEINASYTGIPQQQDDLRSQGPRRFTGGKLGPNKRRDEFRRVDNFCGYSGWAHSDRGGWRYSRQSETTSNGQDTGRIVKSSRVLSVEVLELGNNRGAVQSDGDSAIVYDIEVDGNNNYFANGILVHNCMIRRLKEEVLTDLPPKTRQIMTLPSTGAEREIAAEMEAYANCKEKIATLRAKFEVSKASAVDGDYRAAINGLRDGVGDAFAAMARARKAVAIAKLPTVIDHIEEQLENDQKIIVFCHHREIHDSLTHHFGKRAVGIIGGNGLNARQAAVDRFQTDDSVRVFVGSIMAAGTGLTLTASSQVVMAELDWTPSAIVQCEDRAHRVGQRNNVLSQWIVLEGSLDSRIAKILMDKAEIIEQALDRKPGETVEVTERQELNSRLDILMDGDRPSTASATRDKIEQEAERLTSVDVLAIARALQSIHPTGNVDSKVLADLRARGTLLTAREAALGLRIAQRHIDQLQGEPLETLDEIASRVWEKQHEE